MQVHSYVQRSSDGMHKERRAWLGHWSEHKMASSSNSSPVWKILHGLQLETIQAPNKE